MPTTQPALTLPDQLAASLAAWIDAHRPAGFPAASAMPCVVAVRGGVAELPALVVGISEWTPHPAMDGQTGELVATFDLLTPWGTAAEAATNDAAHLANSYLLRTALAAITKAPGPLAHIWIHDHEDAGREHTPHDTHAMSRLMRRFWCSLGAEVTT